ncbi:hypothetical protein VC83_00660 [Pseudogymnoascus destructans]|uniref:Uncharacterized protein n=2 Tax=Pseudogymnoascus destructans TaxID=655981 RepID=L8FTU9_PSED2|nr:uncharacterized protein VC83_00660 [Pseudogymnoascus destructans]ELR03974.1 hypothetical protein GMDG_06496 [Pseudogymnoascus destructans 20631-21]OAF63443.1 hypothetical protein VC83_00660 [Pseudogymnoascus destructans]
MSARFISASLIRTVIKNGRSLDVQIVDRTTLWTRPSGFPSAGVQDDFVNVVEENASVFSENTTAVAMKESEHQSDLDKRMHYTAFELDKNNNVIATQHLVKQR